ncbi:MAG: hypothetical protein H0T73_22380, partial [Ardenticatenales bacterium]|nr:hypothetical protein [Ardenticatenales bacterium]
MPTIQLKAKRERAVQQRHPWLFSGAIAHADAQPGEVVSVQSASGEHLAWGYYNPQSQIQVRLLRWGEAQPDRAWWWRQLERAISARAPLLADGRTSTVRLINAESDGLPGLVVDQYGEWLVLQALTLGIDGRKAWLAEMLLELTGARGVWERSDESVRKLEGLRMASGPL